jgi:MscS family membrane protein
MVLGLTYSSTPEQIAAVVADLRALLRERKGLVAGTEAVYFTEFGASSLDLLIVYFTGSIDFAEHHELRQAINLDILRIVARNGCSVAFPTRTLHIESVPPGAGVPR